MEARIVQLPTAPEISVDADRIVIDRLVVRDPALAAILGERAPEDRAAVVERALRIGLLALQDAGATVNVDLVRTEFEKLAPPDRAGQRSRGGDARPDAPVELRRR